MLYLSLGPRSLVQCLAQCKHARSSCLNQSGGEGGREEEKEGVDGWYPSFSLLTR